MPGMRSKAYPAIELAAAINRAGLMHKNVGSGVYFDREATAQAMGYKSLSGAAARAIAALVHFGLLERKKDTYTLSDLAIHIVLPISDEDKQEAIRSAATEPELYRDLIQAYSGQRLPAALSNVLARNHGINPKSSAHAADTFAESIRYAGLMKGDILINNEAADDIQHEDEMFNETESKAITQINDLKALKQDHRAVTTIIRKLPSGIEIGFPHRFDYEVMVGEFAEQIKSLEEKAQEILTSDEANEGISNEKTITEK